MYIWSIFLKFDLLFGARLMKKRVCRLVGFIGSRVEGLGFFGFGVFSGVRIY